MFCTENKQTRCGSWTSRLSMMEIFVTIYCYEVISYYQSNSNLDDRGIVELSLYAIIFNFLDEIQRIGGRQRHRGLRHFTNWCFLAFLGVRNLIYWFFCWKIVVLWQINLHPGLSTKCYFEWKHLNKFWGCPKPGNAPFRNK